MAYGLWERARSAKLENAKLKKVTTCICKLTKIYFSEFSCYSTVVHCIDI